MRRRRFLALAMLLGAAPALAAGSGRFERGLLWRVTKEGVAASHIYGTMQAADARLGALPAPALRAFEAATALMLEFVPDPFAGERYMQAAMFHDHQTLEQAIGAADFARALEELAPLGLPREVVNKMKPWSVLLNLRHSRGPQGASLEHELLEQARRRGMPLFQIEHLEEQIFTFDEFPMDSQVALLRHSLAHGEELGALAERSVQAYLAQDLAGLWRLREEFAARHPEIAVHQAVMTKRVIHDRNVVMAFRMQRQLRRGGAFIALGAVHLYGGKGVLALLEEDGYRARRAS